MPSSPRYRKEWMSMVLQNVRQLIRGQSLEIVAIVSLALNVAATCTSREVYIVDDADDAADSPSGVEW